MATQYQELFVRGGEKTRKNYGMIFLFCAWLCTLFCNKIVFDSILIVFMNQVPEYYDTKLGCLSDTKTTAT